jgi:hypothetical protein
MPTSDSFSHEEIVRKTNEKFTPSYEELMNSSKAARRAKRIRKQDIDTIPPRPPNTYMIYGRDKAEAPI